MTVAFLEEDSAAFRGDGGPGLGLEGLSGWGVELDTVYSDGYDEEFGHHLAVVAAPELRTLEAVQATLRAQPLAFEIHVDEGMVTVLGGRGEVLTVVLDIDWPERGYVGFTAATSARNQDKHLLTLVRFVCR